MTIRILPESEQQSKYLRKDRLTPQERAILVLLLDHKFRDLKEINLILSKVAAIEAISAHDGEDFWLKITWVHAVTYLDAEYTSK